MTKKSKMILALASMLGVSAGATAISGFAWFTTTKSATVDITNIGVYSKSSGLDVTFKTAIKGCTDDSSAAHDINVKGAVGAAKTEVIKGENSAEITLSQYPSAKPTLITVGGADVTAQTTWVAGTKTLTLPSAATTSDTVNVTYTPYAALTDVSSVDGQHIYKPIWTAGGEGQYATGFDELSADPSKEGYLSFSMTLTASGASPLAVYLDGASISGATNDPKDSNAAAVARVAIIEDAADPANRTTRLVLQNEIGTTQTPVDNLGVSKTFAEGSTNGTYMGQSVYDLATMTSAVSTSVFAEPDPTNKKGMSSAPTTGTDASNNFVCNVPAGQSKDIIVTIWLEGTNGTGATAAGAFTNTIENAMIKVSLPLIAF